MYIFAALYRQMKDGQLVVNPAPYDKDTPDALFLAQLLTKLAPVLAQYGCGAVLWPPLTMSQGGCAPNADGYGIQYHLNVGQFSNPTRWGFAYMVQTANRVFHQLGMLALEDAVIHQMAGNPPFYELGSNGKRDVTLFPKGANCFCPPMRQDVAFSEEGNQAFGQRVGFTFTEPIGYMAAGMLQAMLWRRKRFGLDGMRLDDTKGTDPKWTHAFLSRTGGFNFCETFDGNPQELARFVAATNGAVTLDFTTHWMLQAICDSGTSLRAVPGNGFYARDPDHSILFVDSADTDLNNGENIKFNKLWAYLLVLTLPAKGAEIYAGDYIKYGLGKFINQIMWAGAMFAIGQLTWEHVEDNLIVWSRNGDGGAAGWSGGLLCGFSRDPVATQSRWVSTPFGPNQHLHDYLGHGPDIWTNQDGWVYLSLGPNVNGTANNGVMYSKAGVNQTIQLRPIKEHMEGSLTDFSDITVKA